MSKQKLFNKETSRELLYWSISGVALIVEYCLYTRFDDLSIGSIPMAYYNPTDRYVAEAPYTPPSLAHSAGLSFLFIFVMVPTALVFFWLTKRLITKFGKWLVRK